MRYGTMFLFAALFGSCIDTPAQAADILVHDFERGPDLSQYKGLDPGRIEAEIVEGGADGTGHCLKLHNTTPATSCAMRLVGPIEVQKNLILAFDYRVEIEEGFEGAYLGMSWFVDGEQWFWTSDAFSNQWRHAQIQIPKLRSSGDKAIRPGLVFSHVQIYGRVKETTKVRTATKARMTVWFDNIRLYTGHPHRTLSERTRDSYSNPPLFHWPKFEEEGGQRLQYSRKEDFPEAESVKVDAPCNFYMPPEPIEPGTWYWRVWSESPLSDGWSDVERVTVVPEAHRFTTSPVTAAQLSAIPRPRLLPYAKISEPNLTDQRKAQLVENARKIHDEGVQPHPGPHEPGDPRWPTWIDWYGKVAGKITGGTGRRLQRIAGYAMLTGDPQVIQWTKELALETCKWDPEGGSAMRRGDIGAHHLLRGLNWCYDACHDSMTPEERQTLQDTIVARANQFHAALNPFRGGEANNHAWLKALGLAESGIVLAGDCEEAAAWTEYVRQLYVGRFLCCLGYQGDNNEGVSYWGYGLMFVVDYADLMKTVCGIDLFQHPWLNQTARFPMYCAPPNGWAVSFADTGMPNHGTRGPAQTRRVRDLALRTRDPYALWYSGQREEVDGLVPKPPTDLPQSIHYRHIGTVIFNTSLVDANQGVTVAMHSGRYFAGHQHPDQNSFVINAYGEKLAIDGGYYDWYGSPHFKAYSMTTLAHNTLLVDGQGQAVCKTGADGRVAEYSDSSGYGYTVGDASNPVVYGGLLKRFERRILFIKPGFVVIHDLVASSKDTAKLDWMLHAVKPITTDPSTRRFSLQCEKAALRGRFLSPIALDLSVQTGFPVEPVNRYSTDPVPADKYFPEWILYASPKRPTGQTEFLAAMQIQRFGEKEEPAAKIESVEAENAHGVSISSSETTHLILFRKAESEGPSRCGKLDSDGAVAAVELTIDGKIFRAFAADATYLRYGGRELFKSPTTESWSMP